MASTLGDPFPLSGTGGAAMARLELSSSGVRHRKAAESSGASPGWSSPGAQGRGEVGTAGWGNWGCWAKGGFKAPTPPRVLQHRTETTSSDRTLWKTFSKRWG